jgi:predicted alpha-1,6-mannanase (GH76 family)
MLPSARSDLRSLRVRRSAALPLAALLAAAVLSACGGPGAPSASTGAAPGASTSGGDHAARVASLHARADAATDALVARFWNGGAGDFAHASPTSGAAAGYWISANALETIVDAAERTGEARYLDVVRAFVAAQDGRGWTRDWFDDEAWMAVALLRAHDLTRDRVFLERAAALVVDIFASAPDGSCCGADAGGLWWDRPHTQKATASNAVPVIAAARLYERTGEARWLDDARRAYGFWRDHMVAASGQVVDHVLPSGERVWWSFSYDGGALLGAALALHHATGEAPYLADARRFAGFLLSAQTRSTSFGPVLFDGDCDAFKGIAHRYLSELAAAAPDVPGLPALLAADADAVWTIARDPSTGTFGVDWGGPASAVTSLAAQASAAMVLNLEAARSGPRPAPLAAR